MAQIETSHWLSVTITLINKSDLTETTVKFYNKAVLGSNEQTEVTDGWPLLIGGTRIGSTSDRESILFDAGSITINNSIGSFGVDRKFSDILERYEIANQDIIIYYGTSAPAGRYPTTTQTAFLVKVLDWSHSIDQGVPTLDIRFDARKFPRRVVNRKIDSDLFNAAPFSSIGKSLPVIFGADVQVKPIYISTETNNSSPAWAYATTLASEHPVGGISAYYAKDVKGTYQQVSSASSTSAFLYGNNFASGKNSAGYGSNTVRAVPFTPTTAYVVTSGYLAIKKNLGTDNESMTIEIRASDRNQTTTPTSAPGTILAKGVCDLATLSSAAGEYQLEIPFDKAIVLQPSTTYYFVSYYSNKSTTGLTLMYYDGGISETAYNTAYTTEADGLWVTSATAKSFQWYWQLKGVVFNDFPSGTATADSHGLGAAYFYLTQKSFTEMPQIQNLDFVVAVNGLKDDSSGTITGTPSATITGIADAIELMSQTWDGSAWSPDTGVSGNWNFNDFSSTYAADIAITGATNGQTTFEQWLRDVCRNTATKIVQTSTQGGQLTPYCWGTTRTSAATFTQENSKVTRLEQSNPSFVINKTTIAYSKRLIYFDSLIAASQGVSSDYTAILNLHDATSAEYTSLIGNSEAIYGERSLADIFFNWIDSLALATRVARFYLTNYNEPPKYVNVEAPFDRFGTLSNMNVVTIINPSLPNYYGGIPNAKLPHYLGETVDVTLGYNLCEALPYRAQIEGKTLTFNEDAAPTLNLVCRLLTNPNDPT